MPKFINLEFLLGLMSDSNSNKDYLTKSGLKTWVSCPRKYYFQYIEDREVEETEAMVEGSKIHELIEAFYENAIKFAEENEEPPTTMFSLIDDTVHDDWRDYLDPYLANFLGFERLRWENVDDIEDWTPIAIEEGMWEQVVEETPPFTGYADVLLPAASIDEVSDDTGSVLIDFKTGEPKNEKYRDHENAGVFLDLAYYKMLFESEFDIKAVGGYYPKTDTLVVSSIEKERREFIEHVSKEISNADPDNIEDFPLDMGPLCAWGEDENQRCEFYNDCPSTWAKPIDNEEETVDLIKSGLSNDEIADQLGTTEDAVSYWIYKKRWHRYR
jgi:CRISPR/Cas system-associated exonuclease Cas4 (RecB family)